MAKTSSWYRRIDKKLGGRLPGGVTPKQVKAASRTSTGSTVRLTPDGPQSVAPTPYFKPSTPSSGSSSGSSSSRSSSGSSGGRSVVDWKTGKAYDISASGVKTKLPSVPSSILQSVSRGSSSNRLQAQIDKLTANTSTSNFKDRAAELNWQKTIASQAEYRRKINERNFNIEKARIEKVEQQIKGRGGHSTTRILTEATPGPNYGDKIKIETIKVDSLRNGVRVQKTIIIRTNLRTGVKTTRTYDRGRLTGGVSEGLETRTSESPIVSKITGIIPALVRAGVVTEGYASKLKAFYGGDFNKKKYGSDFKLIYSFLSNFSKKPSSKRAVISAGLATSVYSAVKKELYKTGERGNSLVKTTAGYVILMNALLTPKKTITNVAPLVVGFTQNLKTKEGRTIVYGAVGGFFRKIYDTARYNPTKFQAQAEVLMLDIYLGFKIGSAASTFTKKSARKLLALNPRLLKIVNNTIKLKGGKILKVGGVKEGAESLSKQLARGGTEATAVTASSVKLIGLIKRKRIIRKPLPLNEKLLTTRTRALLKEFDNGKLNSRQVLELNKRLRVESIDQVGSSQIAGIDLLERSTYFDPDSLIRKSRLALSEVDRLERQGDLFDLLSGKASLFGKRQKPQILILNDMIERLPRTKEFVPIINKLKRANTLGKKANLNKEELARLSRWQVTPSGKLKPIGSTTWSGGIEREITLAPGEIIKRVKKIGTLLVDGQRVPIIAVKIVKGKENVKLVQLIWKLKKELDDLLKRKVKAKSKPALEAINQKLKVASKKLDDILNKIEKDKTKKYIKLLLEDRRGQKKLFPTYRRLGETGTRVARRVVSKRTVTKRAVSKRTGRPTSRTSKRVTRSTKRTTKTTRKTRPIKRTPRPIKTTRRATRPSRPARPKTPAKPRTPKRPVPFKVTEAQKRTNKKKPLQKGYDSFVKKRKVVNTKTLPFSKERAFDLLAYYLDKRPQTRGLTIKSLERTPKATLMRELKKAPKGYFKRNRKKFTLTLLKKKGKKTYKMVEKKKYQRDSKLEKRKVVKRKSPSKRKRRTTKKRK